MDMPGKIWAHCMAHQDAPDEIIVDAYTEPQDGLVPYHHDDKVQKLVEALREAGEFIEWVRNFGLTGFHADECVNRKALIDQALADFTQAGKEE